MRRNAINEVAGEHGPRVAARSEIVRIPPNRELPRSENKQKKRVGMISHRSDRVRQWTWSVSLAVWTCCPIPAVANPNPPTRPHTRREPGLHGAARKPPVPRCALHESNNSHTSDTGQEHMRSAHGRAGALGDRADGRRRRAGGLGSGERGGSATSRPDTTGGVVGGRPVEAVGGRSGSDSVRARQGDGFRLSVGRGGRRGVRTIGRRQKREQESGCYRREMHVSDVIRLILSISTVKASRVTSSC